MQTNVMLGIHNYGTIIYEPISVTLYTEMSDYNLISCIKGLHYKTTFSFISSICLVHQSYGFFTVLIFSISLSSSSLYLQSK